MLFAAYPPPGGYPPPGQYPPPGYNVPPPPPKKSVWPWLLGGCGGCVLLAVIGFVALGMFGYNVGKRLVARSQKVNQFVRSLQSHQYAQAEALLSPQARSQYSVDKLESTISGYEEKMGRMTGYVNLGMNGDASGGQQQAVFQFPYQLRFEHGVAMLTLKCNGFGSDGDAGLVDGVEFGSAVQGGKSAASPGTTKSETNDSSNE